VALTYLIDTSMLKRMGQPLGRAAVEPLEARGEVARPASHWRLLRRGLTVAELT